MPTDHRAALANIKTFPQLIVYLRDEMGWPIARDSFEDVDDLFYDFTADELGIDPKTAAKITEIKRLKPLSTRQPWGIFFVKFEPKKLPVVALRRILSQVALKKRASANSADRTAWAADDLLFVSNYGEGSERQISFAHFAKPQDGHDLPTLKVLGWDNRDTALHLDAVAKELTQHLAWPDDAADVEGWRKGWRGAFTLSHREVVTTSKELSIRLAKLAGDIRDRIKSALAIETDRGPLTKLIRAFQTSLVHDLDADGFADMYAQTIAYGLLSARIADPHKRTVDDFAGHMRTNPFLRELMETFLKVGGRRGKAGGPGIDFDELGVSEVVDLLDQANMEAVVRDFGDRNPQEDPVIHFYEHFLAAYDKKQKVSRGVFYTPRPVVSYIVRSVDELLRTEFGLADGLADTTTWGEMAMRHADLKIPDGVSPDQDFVQILDPATGTGTFLVEVIDLIHKTLAAKWKAQGHGKQKIDTLWNEYVPKHLLTRLHGYELLMAPYAIAHLKIGLKLYETGYRFGSDERARVYLTNALEPATDSKKQMEFKEWIPALAHEAAAVNEIKRLRRFTTVIGNPPYSVKSYNNSPWIHNLIDDFKRGLNETKINLDDDFIKFLRYAEHQAATTGCAVVGMITNNIYLSGVTHRQMRKFLLDSFQNSRFCNLHGDSRYNEIPPHGLQNENVFDIQQGVSIAILARGYSRRKEVSYADVWGTYDEKCELLMGSRTISYKPIQPVAPHYFLQLPSTTDTTGYSSWPLLTEWMPTFSNGIETHKDALTIHFTREELRATATKLLSSTTEKAREYFDVGKDGRDWQLRAAVDSLRKMSEPRLQVQTITYRPFDFRYTVLNEESGGFLAYPRWEVMSHLVKIRGNLALVSARLQARGGEWDSCLMTRFPTEKKTGDSTRSSTIFPLFVTVDGLFRSDAKSSPNISPALLQQIATNLGEDCADASQVLFYIYAVMHSPGYRARYAEFLKIEFPRLPLTENLELFRALARLGDELVALHLLESPELAKPITEFVGGRNPEVEKVSWSKNTVWIDKALTTGFKGVREEVWNFHIGGYQVCNKWLKDRKGRTLSKDDIAHYQKIVVALAETIRLMKEIDEVIEQHGGWPGAFASSFTSAPMIAATDEDSPGNVIPTRDEAPPNADLYEIEAPPLRKAAEPRSPVYNRDSSATGGGGPIAPAEDMDRDELICQIRRVFNDGGVRQREAAIAELARELGYQRTGSRIHAVLDDAIRTAVRRGILGNADGALRIGAKSIEQYEREFLKDQFLSSLDGVTWTEREQAIRAFARWLGFLRTGPTINETARSLINGLIREARLESEGTRVRRVR